jgi:hypothetical protein
MKLLVTDDASDYLFERYGIRRAPAYLAKLRSVGGGPKFRRIGARGIAYEPAALDEWAASIVSEALASTSQQAA